MLSMSYMYDWQVEGEDALITIANLIVMLQIYVQSFIWH
jgi:hypothetical protein